ncbi:MAG: FAD-binding oxidoreductase, partial [Ahrensia sp.]
TVDAGCVLQTIQDAADTVDRLFPLSLASQGSCQIGGNLSANAGGTGALSYGVARDLVVGLEVVLPNGDILNDLSKLKKDNTGYALRHLFIGAEGTLGIITGATLKLFAKPKGYGSVFANVASVEAALTLLQSATDRLGPGLTTFELMADIAVDFADRHMEGAFWPSEDRTGWTVFMEYSSLVSDADANQKIEAVFEDAFAKGLISDGAMAQNAKQRQALWALRESLSEAQGFEGHSIKHDISVPVSSIPAFVAQAEKDVHALSLDARICAFGHMGDGNLHYNISQPEDGDADAFKALAPAITQAVHQRVISFGGSTSAEHGIGQMKRDELAATKDPVALSLMRGIKRELDPANIMNPGKVIIP